MFLNALNIEEKVKFLNLLHIAANIDGEFADAERRQIDAYIAEMGLSPEQTDYTPQTPEEVLAYFSGKDIKIRKSVFVELLAIVFADGKYVEAEKNLVKQAQTRFSLSDEFVKEAHNWINEITPMYLKGFRLVELI